MALKVRNQTKLITASGGGTLRADEDESFLVHGIHCDPSTNDTFVTIYVGGVTLAKIRVKGKSGNHLPYPFAKTAQIYEDRPGALLGYLRARGREIFGQGPGWGENTLEGYQANPLDLSIPVASGETLTVSRFAEAGDVCLVYDIYEAGDVTPAMPNGTRSNVRRYIHYADNAAAITTTPYAVTNSLMWSGGDEWPFNALSVAERNQFSILALVGCPASHGSGAANKGVTTHWQVMLRNNVLFDEDRNGIPFEGETAQVADAISYIADASLIGPLTAENPAAPLILVPALEFVEGDKLTTQMVLANAAAGGIAANELDVAYVLEHRYGAAA